MRFVVPVHIYVEALTPQAARSVALRALFDGPGLYEFAAGEAVQDSRLPPRRP